MLSKALKGLMAGLTMLAMAATVQADTYDINVYAGEAQTNFLPNLIADWLRGGGITMGRIVQPFGKPNMISETASTWAQAVRSTAVTAIPSISVIVCNLPF